MQFSNQSCHRQTVVHRSNKIQEIYLKNVYRACLVRYALTYEVFMRSFCVH